MTNKLEIRLESGKAFLNNSFIGNVCNVYVHPFKNESIVEISSENELTNQSIVHNIELQSRLSQMQIEIIMFGETNIIGTCETPLLK